MSYELIDHVERLRKEAREKERQERIAMDRPKRRKGRLKMFRPNYELETLAENILSWRYGIVTERKSEQNDAKHP